MPLRVDLMLLIKLFKILMASCLCPARLLTSVVAHLKLNSGLDDGEVSMVAEEGRSSWACFASEVLSSGSETSCSAECVICCVPMG
jgi:hypothetical protein